MTSPTVRGLKGLDTVLRNLNKQIKKIEGRTLKGLIRGAIIIRRSMDKTPPKIPVDLGNLRASFFTVTSKGVLAHGSSPEFGGEDASKLSSEHQSVIASVTNLTKATPGLTVILGFSADYAIWVHEMIGGNIDWNREGSGAKFFEAAIKRNAKAVFDIIVKEARIK